MSDESEYHYLNVKTSDIMTKLNDILDEFDRTLTNEQWGKLMQVMEMHRELTIREGQ